MHRTSRRHLLQAALLGGVGLVTLPEAQRSRAALARSSDPDTLTIATNRTPSDLDPHSAYDPGSGMVLPGPFEGLLRLKPGSVDAYEPVLAESWSANHDGSVWTFRLRDGVTFHDGTPLTAETARDSFVRLLRLGLAPSNVLGRFVEDPAQIAVQDARTLIFDLGRPQPLFEAAIAAPFGSAIVNVAALRQHEADGDFGHAWAQASSEGLGTGPYRIVDFDMENGVVLERFDGYWGGWGGDHFERVIIRIVVEPETRRALIENGDADLATALPYTLVPGLEQHPNLAIDRRYGLAVNYLAMTVAGPLQSPMARQAMCYAFPYQEVIDGVYEGFAKRAIGPVAELCRGFEPATFVYGTDLARARALLGEAGVAAGTSLHMTYVAGNPETQALAELFQANLAQIDIELEINSTDFATYVAIAYGDMPVEERPHFFPAYWQPDYNDAWSHLWPQLSCDTWHGGNFGHYCNERVQQLLVEARNAREEEAYRRALGEVQQIVSWDDPAAIYVAQPQWLTVLRRDVGGFAPHLVVSGIINFYDLYRESASTVVQTGVTGSCV